jgi:hypothetical protein
MAFSEEEILETFNPILEALTLNAIPSFYQISSENVVIDSQERVRLCHPIFAQNNYNNWVAQQYDLYAQLAIVLLQAALLLTDL